MCPHFMCHGFDQLHTSTKTQYEHSELSYSNFTQSKSMNGLLKIF